MEKNEKNGLIEITGSSEDNKNTIIMPISSEASEIKVKKPTFLEVLAKLSPGKSLRMALDDIHPDAGPFEFVPGSHKWPLLRRELVWNYMDSQEIIKPDWPTVSEKICVPAFEDYIQRTGSQVQQFLGKKGDVLIWHGRLAHRGSLPSNTELERKALISHYSALSKREDMPYRAEWNNGQWYFIHNNQLDKNSPNPTIFWQEKYSKVFQNLGVKVIGKLKKLFHFY